MFQAPRLASLLSALLDAYSLQRIFKLRILSIGEIQKFLVLQFDVIWLRPDLSFQSILISAVQIDEGHVNETYSLDSR